MDQIRQSERRALLSAIVALSWPTMLEQLMQTAVQYIDTAMVGSLGVAATAAVGSTNTVNWLVGSTVSAFSVGFLAYIAKSFGEGDVKKAKRAVAQSALVVLVLGCFITALVLFLSPYVPVWMKVDPAIRELASRYFFILYSPMLFRTSTIIFGTVLRASGDAKTPMRVGVWVNIINVTLNFLFIYPTREMSLFGASFTMPGLGMGVVGAALASAIAFTVGGVYIAIVVFRHKVISPIGESFKPDKNILLPCFRVAIPNMFERFATNLGYVVFASMINSVGGVATAAHTIANTVESAFYIPGFGMRTAAATLAGNAYGAKDNRRMKEMAKLFIPIELMLMAISGAALFIFAEPLVSIFSKDSEVIRLGTTVLKMVAVSEPVFGFSIIVEGFLQGVGKTKLPFALNTTGMWLVRILGTYICIHIFGMGLIAAWACMIGHNVFRFILYLICYKKGIWNPLERKRVAGATLGK